MKLQEDTLQTRTGATSIYLLDRSGKQIVIPVTKTKNILPLRVAYPPNFEKILSEFSIEHNFFPGIYEYLTQNKLKDEIGKLEELLFIKQTGLEAWTSRRVREQNGTLRVDGPYHNSFEHKSEIVGEVRTKIGYLHQITQLFS